jgi:ribosomal protein S18 acetylase RimI-like enzyme
MLKFTRHYGLAAALGHAYNRLLKSLFPPMRQVFCAILSETPSHPEAGDQTLNIQAFPSLSDVPSAVLEELLIKGTIEDRKPCSMDEVTSFLGWLFSRGAVFWGCFEGQNLIGYLWSLRGSTESVRHHFFPLGTRDAVFLAHEVFPSYRGRELNRKMTRLVLNEMKAKGVERVYVDVEMSNERSLKSFSKTPFIPIGRARMKNLKNGQIVVWKYQNRKGLDHHGCP